MTNLHFLVVKFSQNLHNCNEDRPSYAPQYQDIFVQYQEGLNIITGKTSAKLKDVHMTIPNWAPSITQYTNADICIGYIIPQESSVYRKSEKYELLRKQYWFSVVHPIVQIDPKLDFMVSRVLLEINHTSLFIYKNILRFRPWSQNKPQLFF